ncbi:Light-harvesting chlorophyll B-binding protein 3 [Hibiscus syriacus]|uniref:Light-harvesting chlorophyll B-binding protein 3 n=1 Tax=Hibiscus syriacus TaxID=106335 RepID=A0A6A3ATV1_HIBSY|nr:Light-harvesting chlorophyll B-binding protein 3 [Hibiscus syriacus]
MHQLENTKPHFICCIKPNRKQLSSLYDEDHVLQQLRCCGVFEVGRISRSGYPARMAHQKFAERYGSLLLETNESQGPLSISVDVLKQFNVLPEMYQISYTNLYLRIGQIGALEDRRKQALPTGVTETIAPIGATETIAPIGATETIAFADGEIQGKYTNDEARSYSASTKEVASSYSVSTKEVASSYSGSTKEEGSSYSASGSQLLDEQLTAILDIQSVIRGCLVRKHLSNLHALRRLRSRRTRSRKNSEVKDIPNEQPSAMAELQRRILEVEATLGQKEQENVTLREQLRQCEEKMQKEQKNDTLREQLQQYDAKMQKNWKMSYGNNYNVRGKEAKRTGKCHTGTITTVRGKDEKNGGDVAGANCVPATNHVNYFVYMVNVNLAEASLAAAEKSDSPDGQLRRGDIDSKDNVSMHSCGNKSDVGGRENGVSNLNYGNKAQVQGIEERFQDEIKGNEGKTPKAKEEIEAPMWVDLTSEIKLNSQDVDEEWFQTSHLFHQCSSSQLKSKFSCSDEKGVTLELDLAGTSSPTLPHSGESSISGEGIKPKVSFINSKGTSSLKTSSVSVITENGKGKYVKHVSTRGGLERSSSPVADNSGGTNTRSTVTSESIQPQQQQKFREVSSRGFGQTSELLTSVRISLRKSCITRPASRVEVNADRSRRMESRDSKSSSGKSSVGSSASGYEAKRSTVSWINRNEQTPDSRNAARMTEASKRKVKPSNMHNKSNLRGKEGNCNSRIGGLVTITKQTKEEAIKSKASSEIHRPKLSLLNKVNEQKSLAGATKAREKVGVGSKVIGFGKENNTGEIHLNQKCNGKGKAAEGMVAGRKGLNQSVSAKGGKTETVAPKGRVGNQRRGENSTSSIPKILVLTACVRKYIFTGHVFLLYAAPKEFKNPFRIYLSLYGFSNKLSVLISGIPKDPYGSSLWTVRQKAYIEALKLDTMFTPQLVVQGRAQCMPDDEDVLLSTIATALRFPAPSFQANFRRPTSETLQVTLTGSLRSKIDNSGVNVMVASSENGLVNDCSAGENKGKVLSNDFVVRKLEELCNGENIEAKKRISGTVTFTNSNKCAIAVFAQSSSHQIFASQKFQIPDDI